MWNFPTYQTLFQTESNRKLHTASSSYLDFSFCKSPLQLSVSKCLSMHMRSWLCCRYAGTIGSFLGSMWTIYSMPRTEFLLHNRIVCSHLQTSRCTRLHKGNIHIPHIIVSITLLGAGTRIHAADGKYAVVWLFLHSTSVAYLR